jgi:hypothetical protein
VKAIPRIALGLGLAAIAACQAIAGVESRSVDPPPPGPDAGCVLTTDGPAHVRFLNLVPSGDKVDVCIRPAGASSYGRPVFRNGGADCGSLAYTDVTQSLGAPATNVDIKFIPAGQTCAAAPLSESLGVALAPDAVNSVVRVGGFGQAEKIGVFPEETSDDGVNIRIRVVNAAPDLKPLDFGVTHDAHLPTVIDVPILSTPIAFGQTSPPNGSTAFGVVDAHSYLKTLPAIFEIGLAEDGTTKALVHAEMPQRASTFTLYAIGATGSNNKYPVRGLLCNEWANGPTAKPNCALTTLPSLSVTAFNVSLFGPNANNENERRPYLKTAIQQSDADFMCVFEASRGAQSSPDDQNVTFKGLYPYQYSPATDLTTPFSDPTDQNGNTPPAPTAPPCGGVDTSAVFQCMEAKCSNAPAGDPSGALIGSTSCLSAKCASQFIPILRDHPTCFACLIDYVESQAQYGATQNACANDIRQPFAFLGQNPTMLLSRYPLSNQEIFVLPSTNFRRAVLYAQAQLEDQTIDVFCGFISSTLIYSDLPYTGQYAPGFTSGDSSNDQGYLAEQQLQAKKIVAYVKQKTDASKHPGILIGDWHASVKVPDPNNAMNNLVDDQHPDTVAIFRDGFKQLNGSAVVNFPMWAPSCTDCPASINPYNGDVTSKWLFNEMYLVNWTTPANATIDQSIVFNQPVVPLSNGDGGTTNGMLSLYFGLNAKIIRP